MARVVWWSVRCHGNSLGERRVVRVHNVVACYAAHMDEASHAYKYVIQHMRMRHTSVLSFSLSHRHSHKRTNKQTYTHTHTHIHTHRLTDRQTDRQTDRHTHTYTHTRIHTHTHTHTSAHRQLRRAMNPIMLCSSQRSGTAGCRKVRQQTHGSDRQEVGEHHLISMAHMTAKRRGENFKVS